MSFFTEVTADELEVGMRVYNRTIGRIMHVERITQLAESNARIVVFEVYEIHDTPSEKVFEVIGDEQ